MKGKDSWLFFQGAQRNDLLLGGLHPDKEPSQSRLGGGKLMKEREEKEKVAVMSVLLGYPPFTSLLVNGTRPDKEASP